jgi:uncharacterized low-complexity protein
MRILLSAALAASLAAGSLSALAQQTAPATPAPMPAKQKACKTLKDETSCGGQQGCTWSKPGDSKGKCKTAPKPKST